ncbi:MAG: MBL fold metallo-hydrolase [Deltaproteobacteria bacterium]|nr:MBL fold metallo-hydrolase [Deltaproteobacteria bacterium]
MRFSVLASGSKGNACYIETADTKIVVDAGLSCSEMIRRLKEINRTPRRLDAVFLTHEHSDHIKGAGPTARRFGATIYSNSMTLKKCSQSLGNIPCVAVETGGYVTLNDLKVKTFTKCHDAVDPMGMIFSSNGASIGLITDLGRSTRLVEENLKECKALIIEFNHDVEMLDHGTYPLYLKRRIKGQEGHLSNKQAGELLKTVAHKGLLIVVLAHLSLENNMPEKAYHEAKDILTGCGYKKTRILISGQDNPMPLVEI